MDERGPRARSSPSQGEPQVEAPGLGGRTRETRPGASTSGRSREAPEAPAPAKCSDRLPIRPSSRHPSGRPDPRGRHAAADEASHQHLSVAPATRMPLMRRSQRWQTPRHAPPRGARRRWLPGRAAAAVRWFDPGRRRGRAGPPVRWRWATTNRRPNRRRLGHHPRSQRPAGSPGPHRRQHGSRRLLRSSTVSPRMRSWSAARPPERQAPIPRRRPAPVGRPRTRPQPRRESGGRPGAAPGARPGGTAAVRYVGRGAAWVHESRSQAPSRHPRTRRRPPIGGLCQGTWPFIARPDVAGPAGFIAGA